jgi:chemotaxis protein MotA
LPAGSKLRSRVHAAIQMRELMLEGVLGIAEGLNPKLIRIKLEAYTGPSQPKKTKAAARPKAGAAAAKPVEAAAGD